MRNMGGICVIWEVDIISVNYLVYVNHLVIWEVDIISVNYLVC